MANRLYMVLYGGRFASVVEKDSVFVFFHNQTGNFCQFVEWAPFAGLGVSYGDVYDFEAGTFSKAPPSDESDGEPIVVPAPTLDTPWPEDRTLTYGQKVAALAAAEVPTTDPTALLIERYSRGNRP